MGEAKGAAVTAREQRTGKRNYRLWTTADGRELRPGEMTDLHLLHTLRAIEEGRILPELPADDPLGHLSAAAQRRKDRAGWLAVFRAEAAQRGLDASVPPTRRVDILELSLSLAEKEVGFATSRQRQRLLDAMRRGLARAGIPVPEIDVLSATHEPTYLHWRAGKGVGTPLPLPPEPPPPVPAAMARALAESAEDGREVFGLPPEAMAPLGLDASWARKASTPLDDFLAVHGKVPGRAA